MRYLMETAPEDISSVEVYNAIQKVSCLMFGLQYLISNLI